MAVSPSPSSTALGQVALTVRDVAGSVSFYRDKVGLRFLFDAGPTLSFLDLGGVRLMLSAPEGAFTPGSSTVLYIRVPDIDASFREMRSRGVEFVDAPHLVASMPDHDLWMTFFHDPDAHTLALMCERMR
jgi:methylmalonyl-CoA/ethylmalonyl-CoA epimerase